MLPPSPRFFRALRFEMHLIVQESYKIHASEKHLDFRTVNLPAQYHLYNNDRTKNSRFTLLQPTTGVI